MSGGRFEYKQYTMEDIADCIEREIRKAKLPKPPLVQVESVSILKSKGPGHWASVYAGYETYKEAVDGYKRFNNLYDFVEERVSKDGKRISVFKSHDGEIHEIRETKWEEYEDGEYYPNYSEETLQIFKETVQELRKTAFLVQRIDWLLCGDDSEDTFLQEIMEYKAKGACADLDDI